MDAWDTLYSGLKHTIPVTPFVYLFWRAPSSALSIPFVYVHHHQIGRIQHVFLLLLLLLLFVHRIRLAWLLGGVLRYSWDRTMQPFFVTHFFAVKIDLIRLCFADYVRVLLDIDSCIGHTENDLCAGIVVFLSSCLSFCFLFHV